MTTLTERIRLALEPGIKYSLGDVCAKVISSERSTLHALRLMVESGTVRRLRKGNCLFYALSEVAPPAHDRVPPRRVDLLNRKPWRPDRIAEWNHARARESRNVRIIKPIEEAKS